jgi:hypothetical protein
LYYYSVAGKEAKTNNKIFYQASNTNKNIEGQLTLAFIKHKTDYADTLKQGSTALTVRGSDSRVGPRGARLLPAWGIEGG